MEKINGAAFGKGLIPKYRCWSIGAIECYLLGCNCKKCNLAFFVKNCRMKESVIAFVKVFGAPCRRKIEILEDK